MSAGQDVHDQATGGTPKVVVRVALVLGLCVGPCVACTNTAAPHTAAPAATPDRAPDPKESRDTITCPDEAELQVRGSTQLCILDGAVHGEFARFGPDGERIELARYEHGVLHGGYAVWDTSGTPRVEGSFHRGERAGTWRWYAPEGALWFEADDTRLVEYHPGGQPRFIHDARGERSFSADGSEVPLAEYIASLAAVPVRPQTADGTLTLMLAQTPAERLESYTPPKPGESVGGLGGGRCYLAQRVTAETWPIADDIEFGVTISHDYPLPLTPLGARLHPSGDGLRSSSGQVRLSMLGALSNLPGLVYITGPACASPLGTRAPTTEGGSGPLDSAPRELRAG